MIETKPSTNSKGAVFRALHEREGAFIIPNPWDVGTARILAAMGFPALATTSAGLAFSLGVPEGQVSREATLAHCRALAAATDLPVSADLEKGFGDTPESAAETIRAAAETGLAGCSIEDHTGDRADPIFPFDLAVARIRAAAVASQQLPHDFVLTARCENLLWGRNDLDDTIRRLQAFEAAGADVLYAPGLHDLATIRTVCASVSKPVNVVMGMPGATFCLDDLAAAGVKRVSVGSALARAAFGAFVTAAREMASGGCFTFSQGPSGLPSWKASSSPKTRSQSECRDQAESSSRGTRNLVEDSGMLPFPLLPHHPITLVVMVYFPPVRERGNARATVRLLSPSS